jgi:hypothetical protein
VRAGWQSEDEHQRSQTDQAPQTQTDTVHAYAEQDRNDHQRALQQDQGAVRRGPLLATVFLPMTPGRRITRGITLGG